MFTYVLTTQDLAWVPVWLQQHQIEQFDECIKKLKGTDLELECKVGTRPILVLKFTNVNCLLIHFLYFTGQDEGVSPGKISKGNYAYTLSREEDRNKSYHLFFSGEDNTPADFSSSPGNVSF